MMKEEIVIKKKDAAASVESIVALIKEAHTVNLNSGLHYGTAEISTSEFNDELENSICYIACSESELVGTCMVSKRNVHHWYFSGEAAYIHLVAVHPDYQGRKIGQRIIEEALRDIKNKDEYSFVFFNNSREEFRFKRCMQ